MLGNETAALDDREAPVRDAAAALLRRGVVQQDGLDLLAVIAGSKPVCLVGRGDDAGRDALCQVADAAGLPVHDGAPWEPLPPHGLLPGWYLAATARRRAARLVTYLCGDEAVLRAVRRLCDAGRVAAVAEAALLGYPPCCVAQHHRQALALERLVAEMAARVAGGDAARMVRMIEHGAEPLPATSEEWRRYGDATAIAPATGTSVNMCADCAADASRPAPRLARRYAALAARAAFPLGD